MKHAPRTDAVAIVGRAIDAAHVEADRLREHADVLLAAAAMERASWRMEAALHRLQRAGGLKEPDARGRSEAWPS